MGIFGRSNKMANASGPSVIAAGTKIIGDVSAKDSLFIDGEIEGTVSSDGTITIGKHGSVVGNIQTSRIVIGGAMRGKLECDICEILTSGQMRGDVYSSSLVIEAGGTLEGSSYVINGEQKESEKESL